MDYRLNESQRGFIKDITEGFGEEMLKHIPIKMRDSTDIDNFLEKERKAHKRNPNYQVNYAV